MTSPETQFGQASSDNMVQFLKRKQVGIDGLNVNHWHSSVDLHLSRHSGLSLAGICPINSLSKHSPEENKYVIQVYITPQNDIICSPGREQLALLDWAKVVSANAKVNKKKSQQSFSTLGNDIYSLSCQVQGTEAHIT